MDWKRETETDLSLLIGCYHILHQYAIDPHSRDDTTVDPHIRQIAAFECTTVEIAVLKRQWPLLSFRARRQPYVLELRPVHPDTRNRNVTEIDVGETGVGQTYIIELCISEINVVKARASNVHMFS